MAQRMSVEGLEGRVLFATNAWKTAVTGSWDTAANWSLGHVPTSTEDVQISIAGTYTVTLNTGTTAATSKTLKVGGNSGTQTLVLNRTLNASGAVNVTSGDVVTLNAGATLANLAGSTTAQLDGTINLSANTAGKSATLNWPNVTVNGSGKIAATTGGTNASNVFTAAGASLGTKITVIGKKLAASGFTNNGLILADTLGETISLTGVTNKGNLAAAPGKIKLTTTTLTPGSAITVGLGSTGAGQLNFDNGTTNVALNGGFNVVTIGSYVPAVGSSVTTATFAKAPTGAFESLFLDSGDGRAYDRTQTATAITLKAKASTASATRSGTALTVAGTSGNDIVSVMKGPGGLRYAALAGVTSVFLDRLLASITVNAGNGNDVVLLVDNANTVSLGVRINGQAGNDAIYSDDGNDTLDGGSGNDSLFGGLGNDTYVFNNATAAEADKILENASAGTDTLDFSGMTNAVKISLASNTLATMTNRTVAAFTSGTYANLENANGGSGADTITGNAAVNVLKGNAGNDTLTGGGGADSLYGVAGTDTLYGGGDLVKDLLDGGTGTDVKGSADAIDTLVSIP